MGHTSVTDVLILALRHLNASRMFFVS